MHWISVCILLSISATIWCSEVGRTSMEEALNITSVPFHDRNVTARAKLLRGILEYFMNKPDDSKEDEEEDEEEVCEEGSVSTKYRYLYDDTDTDSDLDAHCEPDYSDDDSFMNSDSEDDDCNYRYYYLNKKDHPTINVYNISYIGRKDLVLGNTNETENYKRDSEGNNQMLLGGIFTQLPLVREIQKLGHETVMSPAFTSVAAYFSERARIGALKVSTSFGRAAWRQLYKFVTQNTKQKDGIVYQYNEPDLNKSVIDRAKKVLRQKIIHRTKLFESQNLIPSSVASAVYGLDANDVVHTLQLANNVTLPMVTAAASRTRNRHSVSLDRFITKMYNLSQYNNTRKEKNYTNSLINGTAILSSSSNKIKPLWGLLLLIFTFYFRFGTFMKVLLLV